MQASRHQSGFSPNEQAPQPTSSPLPNSQLPTTGPQGSDSDEEGEGALLHTETYQRLDDEDEFLDDLPNSTSLAADRDGLDEDRKPETDGGILLRDRPKKTAFYDPVAEREMSQSDAKLIYQLSQLDLQRALQQHETPIDSPIINPTYDAGHIRPRSPLNNKHSDNYRRQPTLPPGALSTGDGSGGAATLQGSSITRGQGLHGIPGNSVAATTIAEAPAATAVPDIDNAGGFAIGEPSGIGSSTYADADPQITAELAAIFGSVQKVIDLRHKYIRLSLQGPTDNPKDDASWIVYPSPPEPAWVAERDTAGTSTRSVASLSNSLASSVVLPPAQRSQATDGQAFPTSPETPKRPSTAKKRKPGQDIGEDFEMDDLLPLPGDSEMVFRLDESGVYQVYENEKAEIADTPIVSVPTLREFYMDLEPILSVSTDGPSKSFAYRRLQYLESKFSLYTLLNEYQETADTKRVPHRDFYNVRKVDTHVHHSACMNQKHLLRFIKSKMKKCPDEVVIFRDGRHLTLAEVFESIKLTAYDLSIDTLDMHAHTDSFHRFDKFNLKYNPIGESRLRTIFLKTDNDIQGRYLAEITKEVIADLESSKYQMVEWRISIYGKSITEWENLAAWVVDNKLFSHNVRWLVQIPRLFDVYKASGLMTSFEQVIRNVFEPLFEATKNPQAYPKLHVFLQRVVGFDSVDDESKVERRLYKKFPVPKVWDSNQNPPYSYWIYYLFSNMATLNAWRKQRGFNTFVLRPHCGEAGDSEHLAVASLCCHSISHGLLLRKVPLLQYIFYLEQIGIAMSPLSNNALFLAYERNPFHQYFKRGLNVSLSTDDPLQFAFTKEPLIEEYAVAAQIYKLNPVDMCELAKNSVMQSGYETSIKQQWLGADCTRPGIAGNTMVKTNIPDRRAHFRHSTLLEERRMIEKYTQPLLNQSQAEANEDLGSPSAAQQERSPTLPNAVPGIPQPLTTSTGLSAAATPWKPKQGSEPDTRQRTISFVSLPAPATAVTATPPMHPHSHSHSQIGTTATSPSLTGPSSIVTPGTLIASPLTMSNEGTWPTEANHSGDAHLSGIEPRYFPGVATRRQRQNSMRQNSTHDEDGGGSRVRKSSIRSGSSLDEDESSES